MSLNTSLKGRLRNTNLPKTSALLPLLEAVVNSIHSIDERIKKEKQFQLSDSFIRVKLIRSGQSTLDSTKEELIGFEIIDNGIGFTENNYNSFCTLDSDYKLDKGCRGIGRLLWLKAFSKVTIESNYKEEGENKYRSFDFNITNDIFNEKNDNSDFEENLTSVKLLNINQKYIQFIPKTNETISHSLLEHCLWYFLREGGAPKITIEDDEVISMDNEFESYMLNASDRETFSIKSNEFEITHVKLKTSTKNKHTIIFSAADRVVTEESLSGKIPGLFGVLNDGENNFCYMCFVSSSYLTEKVTPERLGFNISETVEGLFQDEEISFNEIRIAVIEKVKNYLSEFLEQNKEVGKKKVTDFVAQKAPRYRPILNRLSDDEKIVDPNISDKDLELMLHSHLMKMESELLSEGHNLLQPQSFEDEEDYSQRVENYLSKASDLKKSDLANYVTHRKVILDLFGKAIEKKENGKYVREDVIHKLIMPMQKDSNELFANDSNLWLIDERLAFHNYLASDKTIKSMPITESEVTKEPDLLGLNIYDNPLLVHEGQSLPLASITVVEIKRPMRNDAKKGEEKDPIEQALGYLERIRQGSVNTESGRKIPNSENVPGFCYVLCDLTESIEKRCKLFGLRITADKMGYFGYNDNYGAYIEVISFDRILNMAKERNRAFFDKLGLPTS
jgi:hypothetical protein